MGMQQKTNNLKFWEWFVWYQDPRKIWLNHPSYLMLEVMTLLLALLTFRHAVRNGGRFIYLWLATIFHGWTVECLSYFLPDIDNFWHAQSTIIFLGGRLPLHIVLFYPLFLYTTGAAVSKLHLKPWAEPFAHGLCVVLMDVPFDIMGIKLLWWTWHDTDPNIYDRHYWVPWTSYYFHATFACSFNFIFHGTRKLLAPTSEKYEASSFPVEMLCTVLTGLFSMPMGVLQFLPIYHPLHDSYKIHSEVCVLMILVIYILICWTSDRKPDETARASLKSKKPWFDEISLILLLHYLFYVYLVFFSKPENNSSTGLHEPTGPCNQTSPVQTASGMVLSKKTYLCTTNYDEGVYDWHCLPQGKPPKDGLNWYTMCGTPFPNYTEYKVVVCSFCALGLYIYYQILARSGMTPTTVAKKSKAKYS